MKSLTASEKRRIRLIDGIPFIFYKKYENKEQVLEKQRKIESDGYYTRCFRELELWVSNNPRWFYKLAAFSATE